MNAILYVDRTGIPWRCLPHDFPPWATTYGYFAKWQQDGVFKQLSGLLRRLVREAEGRGAEPSACVLDSQTIKTYANVHLADQGTDAGKRIIGRKRHLGCDTLGLLLTVLVTAASVSDTAAGVTLLSRIAAAHPHIRKSWVDAGYRTTAIDHGARLGIDVHPVHRPPGARGFTIIPRRWTIDGALLGNSAVSSVFPGGVLAQGAATASNSQRFGRAAHPRSRRNSEARSRGPCCSLDPPSRGLLVMCPSMIRQSPKYVSNASWTRMCPPRRPARNLKERPWP